MAAQSSTNQHVLSNLITLHRICSISQQIQICPFLKPIKQPVLLQKLHPLNYIKLINLIAISIAEAFKSKTFNQSDIITHAEESKLGFDKIKTFEYTKNKKDYNGAKCPSEEFAISESSDAELKVTER